MPKILRVNINDNWLASAKAYSRKRYKNHVGQSTYKPLSENHECIGLLGEIAFSLAFGLPLTWEDLNGGGDECDFTIGTTTIDVKTYRRPLSVLCKAHKPHASRIVLAHYISDQIIDLLGWDFYENIKMSQPRDFGRGIINHHKDASLLKSMDELKIDLENIKEKIWQT